MVDGGVEDAGAVEVQGEPMLDGKGFGGDQVLLRQDLAPGGVFQAEKASAGVVVVVGLDEFFEFLEV